MSTSETAAVAAIARVTPVTATGRITPADRVAVYITCTLVALIANYYLGRDLAWDTLNYHLYAGLSAVNDRFAQDYFAAGAPSYFNPYAFVPFYLMVSAGFSPLAISSALAVVHSIIFLLIFELALSVCPSDDRRMQMAYGVCAVAVAFLNPILLQQIGSAFADITTAELVLGGWLLLARSVGTPRTWRIVCAGMVLGAATALKLTNSVHAISAFALFILLAGTVRDKIRSGASYAAALGVGFALVSAPWSYRLAQMFGNPLFPVMNGVFRSAEFTTEPLRHFRFIPASLMEALLRPFAIADPVPMVHEEMTAPDIRYALLVMLGAALFGRSIWKRMAHPASPSTRAEPDGSTRILAALGCGLAADWVLWLSASGNGRYFLPMACVAAVMIVGMLFRLFAHRPKIRNYVLFAVLGIQAIQAGFGPKYRWNREQWDRSWLNVEMPEKLAAEPNLYLTIGAQSNSFISFYLARGSGLINFSGGYALGPEGASGARIEHLLHRYAPHLRALWSGAHAQSIQVDGALARFGLRVDASDCATITLHGLSPEPEITYTTSVPVESVSKPPSDTSYLTSCHVVRDDTDRSAQIARERAIDVVFDRIEDACPALFQPRRMRTEHGGEVWRRLYLNTDLVMLIWRDSVRLSHPARGGQMANLGRVSDWAKAPLRLECGRREGGRYFANLLESKEE